MQISVTVSLAPGETLASPDDAAAQVIAALGGDLSKDYCTVNVMALPGEPGQAGVPPEPSPEVPTV